MTGVTLTLIIEKWQVKPETRWVPHSERKVTAYLTPKRITITEGMDKGMVFNRFTGAQIKRRGLHSWFRYSIREVPA